MMGFPLIFFDDILLIFVIAQRKKSEEISVCITCRRMKLTRGKMIGNNNWKSSKNSGRARIHPRHHCSNLFDEWLERYFSWMEPYYVEMFKFQLKIFRYRILHKNTIEKEKLIFKYFDSKRYLNTKSHFYWKDKRLKICNKQQIEN